MELERERSAAPLRDSTITAMLREQARFHKPTLQVGSVSRVAQQLLDGHGGWAGNYVTPLDGAGP
jgi:hypothetical protein